VCLEFFAGVPISFSHCIYLHLFFPFSFNLLSSSHVSTCNAEYKFACILAGMTRAICAPQSKCVGMHICMYIRVCVLVKEGTH